MGNWAAEFEFVDDESGGKFVAAASAAGYIQTLLARGAVDEATKLFEEASSEVGPLLLTNAKVGSSALRTGAAELFMRARDFGSAAALYEALGKHKDAAAAYEKAGDMLACGKAWKAAGEPLKAGEALERMGNLDGALQLYQQAGAKEAMAECLARAGRHLDAATLYNQLKNVHAEVEMLRAVPLANPQRPLAVKRLGLLMEQYGHGAQAIPLIIEVARHHAAAADDVELKALLVRQLQGAGRHAEAARIQGGATVVAAAGPVVAAAAAAQPTHDAYAYLKAIPVFAELTLGDMHDLYRVAQEVAFAPGAAVLEQGIQGPGLFVLLSGSVDVLVGPKKVNQLGAGANVGEISLVREQPTSARVVATQPVRALFISRERFQHFLHSHAAAALCIYRLFTNTLAQRVQALSAAK